MKSFFSAERRAARGWRWLDSWISKSKIPLEQGEVVHWRALAWRVYGFVPTEGELIVTNERVAFSESRRVWRGRDAYREWSVRYDELDGTSLGSFLDGVANAAVGARRLQIHLVDGTTKDLFVLGAGLTAEIIEAARITWT